MRQCAVDVNWMQSEGGNDHLSFSVYEQMQMLDNKLS